MSEQARAGASPTPALAGHLSVVTGAGQGIGRAVAVRLAREGASVVLAARTPEALEETARLCREAAPRSSASRFLPCPTDVTDEASVAELLRQTLALGAPDSLINCAGVARFQPVQEITLQEWERILNANLRGTFLCCRAALAPMLARGTGQIINIGSILSRQAFANAAAYTASKWGVLGFTKALSEEVRKQGLRVTALLPGAVETPLWDATGGGPDRSLMLRPEHVAHAVIGILTQPAGMVTDEMLIMPPHGVL